ncbi:hypothetical protein DYB32_007599 [Aphanomyces invadans]|uniref:Uncharacterized protein n=1 Tax=Aphanomyces invadans TaxID=157072 RepID=A0A3R6V6V7_9STRA|nr:hypothetical protein DYB32_007599 [Aphanomyces invadans]
MSSQELRAVVQHPLHVASSRKKTGVKEMPDTQFLKAIGRDDLVHAIRKKHGGFVGVAQRLGWHIETTNARESHIKLVTREKRRAERLKEIKKHRVF